jgi:beta-lactam-binding protein with PASTA domain
MSDYITQRTFEVSVPPELRTLFPDGSGSAEATYAVKNTKSSPVRGKARLVPKEGTDAKWLVPPANEERDFRPNEAQQFKVGVNVPADAPPGTYGFRIDVANVANPQEDFTEGDVVAFTVAARKPVPNGGGMPKWLIPVIAAAVLLIAGGIVAAILMTRGIKVPKVVGLEVAQAEKSLVDAGLRLGKITPGQKPGTELGIVLEQRPGEGEKLKKEGVVDLTVQSDPLVSLPNVKDKKLAEVRPSLEQSGLVLKIVSVREGNAAPDTILRQDPGPGSVPSRTEVTLTVQAPPQPPTMPNVVGKLLDEAVGTLTSAGIPFSKKAVLDGPRKGSVVRQSIAQGQSVPPGTTVVLEITGIAVPDLTNRPVAAARATLQNIGLNVGTVKGTVVSFTVPAKNTPVLLGTTVDINWQRLIFDPDLRRRDLLIGPLHRLNQ